MATSAFIIRCTLKELIAPGVYELRFTRPEGFGFKAGQFVLFDTPLIDNPSDIQTRALSIASSPDEADLIFVVKIKPEGRLGQWITKQLEVGTEVRVQGPLGLFTVKDESPLVFVATGAGIAPFRSQIRSLLIESSDMRPVSLLFGVRHREDFFWVDQFESLAKAYPHFRFLPVLSGEDDTWTERKGRVQLHLPEIVTGHSAAGVYICGAPEMVKDVKTVCLEQLALPKKQVHAEGYI